MTAFLRAQGSAVLENEARQKISLAGEIRAQEFDGCLSCQEKLAHFGRIEALTGVIVRSVPGLMQK